MMMKGGGGGDRVFLRCQIQVNMLDLKGNLESVSHFKRLDIFSLISNNVKSHRSPTLDLHTLLSKMIIRDF